jgi:ubiquinone/menaquinone biosynthesis C-methylase UbiE
MGQELWDRERVEGHARWGKVLLRLFYAPFARRIARGLASLKGDVTIVDLGTGPGTLSVELGKLLPQAKVIGIDPSSEMLEMASINADESGMANFETRLGRAEEMPLEANIADLVVSQFSLHEWEDPQKGLSEVFRVLKPGGSLMLRDFNRGWLSKWKLVLLRVLAALTGESYEEHLPMFKFALDQVVALLRQAGFDRIEERGRGPVLFVQAHQADLDATQ